VNNLRDMLGLFGRLVPGAPGGIDPAANQNIFKNGYKAGGSSPFIFFAQILTCSHSFVATKK